MIYKILKSCLYVLYGAINLEEFPPQVSVQFLFIPLTFSFGGGERFKTFVGAAAINTSEHCSANMPTLTLAKSQTVLNFSNYTLTQLTGVISALTLCLLHTGHCAIELALTLLQVT